MLRTDPYARRSLTVLSICILQFVSSSAVDTALPHGPTRGEAVQSPLMRTARPKKLPAKSVLSADVVEVKSDGEAVIPANNTLSADFVEVKSDGAVLLPELPVEGEGSELPPACAKFFEEECHVNLPEPTTEAVQEEFAACCAKGGHEESTCESLLEETFSNHQEQEPVKDSQCKELVDLYKAHVQWAKDHVSSPDGAEALLNSRASGDGLVQGDSVDAALSPCRRRARCRVVRRRRTRQCLCRGCRRCCMSGMYYVCE